jgi:hypothetical protein
MKILITGASGYLGSVLRHIFVNDEVTLLSRKTAIPNKNEQSFISKNLQDDGWWNSLPAAGTYDVVIHLAEPVRKNVSDDLNQSIIDGHISFIEHFTGTGAKVIYPLTAYLYDTNLSRSNRIYANIKQGVYNRLKGNSKVSFPVIHPICDSGHGLGKLIQIEKKIPLINTMCSFDSTIPILRLVDLKTIFSDPISMIPGQFDMFSEILPIREIFKDDARANGHLISRAVFCFLRFLRFIPDINLLIYGRQIVFNR